MEVINFLVELIKKESVTPKECGIYTMIKELLSDFDVIEQDVNGIKNLFLYKDFSKDLDSLESNMPKKPHLCFAGHIDVVPSGSGWSVEPFGGVIKDGIVYGRGAEDMKGGVAAFVYAIKEVKEFSGILSLLLTSDEEGDGIYGTQEMLKELQKRNLLPNFAIVAEPTCEKVFGDTIKIGRRGSINGVLKIQGVQGHVAYPKLCINPIDLIAQILPRLSSHLFDNGDNNFAPSRLVITDIRGGMEVVNVTPSDLKIMFNVRNNPLTNKASVESYIKTLLGEIPHTLELKQSSYPFITNSPLLLNNMLDSIKTHTSLTPKLSTSGGTSDARYFSKFGVEVLEFGVLNDRIHATDECVKIDDVCKLKNIFSTFITNLNYAFCS